MCVAVQCVEMVLGLISDSLDAWRTRQYDYYQVCRTQVSRSWAAALRLSTARRWCQMTSHAIKFCVMCAADSEWHHVMAAGAVSAASRIWEAHRSGRHSLMFHVSSEGSDLRSHTAANKPFS